MVDIKLMTYEESRLQYFIEQRDAAERRVKYWAARARRVGYLSHANEQASNAGDEWSFCNDVIHMLKARSNDGDLVSRSALLEQHGLKYATKHGNQTAELQAHSYSTLMLYEVADMIRDAPTADATPTVYGEWELHANDDSCGSSYFCSNCHSSYDEDCFYDHGQFVPYNYCPNCNAKMRECH